jgi:hypothetical protein
MPAASHIPGRVRRQKTESFPIIAFIFAELSGFRAVMWGNDANGRHMRKWKEKKQKTSGR